MASITTATSSYSLAEEHSENGNSSSNNSTPLASTSMLPQKNNKSSSSVLDDPFYKIESMTYFFPISLVYCAICKVAVFLLKSLFPFLVRDVMSPRELRPEERFVIPSSASSISDDTNDSARHVAIVTGSNTGLGFETASSLVELGYVVILACRNKGKGEEAAAKINARNNQRGRQRLYYTGITFPEHEPSASQKSIFRFC